MRSLRSALLITAALCSGALSITPAAAMPVAKSVVASDDAVQTVAFACGPFRCWWRPNYYYGAPFYVAPPAYVPAYVIPYTSGPTWYGGWRRGFYGGWGRRWY
jgi:hypothetical protein